MFGVQKSTTLNILFFAIVDRLDVESPIVEATVRKAANEE